MRARGLAAFVAIVMAGLGARADDPVTLDVIVTDAKSRPIANLRAADFELADSGEPRSVEDVRLQSGGSRVLAIFLDEYHVQAGDSTARARAALTQFVKTGLRDGDTVAVMKPLDPLNAITVTQDRDKILEAISAFEGRKGDYVARSTFEEKFISRDPKTAQVARAQVVTSALQALATRLGEGATGRRALVLLSEGFTPAMRNAIVYAANRNRVAIYPIDPHPEPTENEAALRTLAEQTGGSTSLNDKDLAPAFMQVISDLDAYYVVTFQSRAPADGKFHPVQVRVKRAGAQTRARAGYWTVKPAPPVATRAGILATPFRASYSSPYIRPWIGMSRGPNGLTSVTVTWEAGQTPPRNQRVASIEIKATGPDGRVLFQNRIGPGDSKRATFDAPPGYIALEMALQSSTGAPLDTDYRGLSVPNLQVTKPTFATPQLMRSRTARGFAELSASGTAIPVASRTFSRAERLLVRIPVYGPGDTTPSVTASLLNRRGVPMRELQRVPADLPAGIVQFDLPLSSLAPDEYSVELVAANAQGPRDEAREAIVFRVTN
jgi:VWFA-related protein